MTAGVVTEPLGSDHPTQSVHRPCSEGFLVGINAKATSILASSPRPSYDVTSGRTTRRWVNPAFYQVTSASPVPAGRQVR